MAERSPHSGNASVGSFTPILGHSTAEAIYGIAQGRMTTISLKTVYETLHSLAALGQIQQLDQGSWSTRFGPHVHHHHHLVCSSCGRIEEST
jgi:Fur family peroxide stress response transcriptional regulator